MKTITETIATVNKFNANILKKSRDNFNELIFLNDVENEDNQKSIIIRNSSPAP